MKLWRPLAWRILVLSVAGGVVGIVGASIASTRLVIAYAMGRTSSFAELAKGEQLRRCASSPQTWSFKSSDHIRFDAYDGRSLKSTNPQSPPLEEELLTALRAGESKTAKMYFLRSTGTAAAYRLASQGPCAVIRIAWPLDRNYRLTGFAQIVLIVMIPVMIVAGVGGFFVAKPLFKRIERLRRAAAKVGGDDYRLVAETRKDELNQVAENLDRAHQRIRSDAAALAAGKKELEEHLRDVSHDLRTPIAALQLSLEQALSAAKDPALRSLVGDSLHETIYLTGLIDDLWVASQLTGNAGIETEALLSVDLAAVTERVASRYRLHAKYRGISLEMAVPDEPVPVRIRSVMAQRALGNVVQNSISYVPHGGNIAVLLSKKPDHTFELVVVDDGPGVPPEQLPRLKGRTFRGDVARHRDPAGGGLGLAITNEVCRRFGLSLSFAAEKPRGLRVTIRGPWAESPVA